MRLLVSDARDEARTDLEAPQKIISLGSPESKLDAVALSFHRSLYSKVVMPLGLAMSLTVFVGHWGLLQDPHHLIWILPFQMLLNVFCTAREVTVKTPLFSFRNRSDPVDVMRWTINFVYDLVLSQILNFSVTVFVVMWITYTFASIVEVTSLRARVCNFVVAASCFLYFFYNHGVELRTAVPSVVAWIGISYALVSTERFLKQSIISFYKLREQVDQFMSASRADRRQALLGAQMASVAHESTNLLFLIEMATEILDRKSPEVRRLRKIIDDAVSFQKSMLDGLYGKGRDDTPRTYDFGSLATDVENLIGSHLRRQGIEVHLEKSQETWVPRQTEDGQQKGLEQTVAGPAIPTDASESSVNGQGTASKKVVRAGAFREKPGSLYIIIHNLMKNAAEAIAELKESNPDYEGHIWLYFEDGPGGGSVRVEDNGPGISEGVLAALARGESASTKASGHGLGMVFVVEECRSNGFQLSVARLQSGGTRFIIEVPWAHDMAV